MHPFGQTVWLWRRARGLTQAALARCARIPRPNLSAIERGRREVSVRTARALALALDVTPGVLVDGMVPGAKRSMMTLSRATLERIADAAVLNRPARGARECQLADDLRRVLAPRILASRRRVARVHGSQRAAEEAWARLEAFCGPALVQSLVQRGADRLG